MALTSEDHFHEFIARIVPDEHGNTVSAMHLVRLRTVMDDEQVVAQIMLPAQQVGWEELTAAMSTPNLTELRDAVLAELAARE